MQSMRRISLTYRAAPASSGLKTALVRDRRLKLVDDPSHSTRVALERVIAFFRDRLAIA